jgi:hypothetical protein
MKKEGKSMREREDVKEGKREREKIEWRKSESEKGGGNIKTPVSSRPKPELGF